MRVLLIILICFFSFFFHGNFVNADEEWNELSGAGSIWDGQKSVTNKEFEDAINILEKDIKKKEEKKKKRTIKKISGGGTSLHSELNQNEDIIAPKILNLTKEEGLLLNLPVSMLTPDGCLEEGFYNVYLEEENNQKYLKFYQAQYLKGKVIAYETNEDFEEEEINFVKLMPYDDDYFKIVYGSLTANVYTYLKYYK